MALARLPSLQASSRTLRASGNREDAADLWVHVLGVSAGLAGFGLLMALALRQADFLISASLAVYGTALVAMLTCSALYSTAREPVRRARLRRIDHAVIFLMIAGTYTPFLVVKIGGPVGYGMLAYVWGVALGGAALKLLFPGRFERLSIALYLMLGWTIVVAVDALFAAVSMPAIVLIGLGGLLYSAGVLIHVRDDLPYSRAIWHAFVLVAAACHFAAILGDVALAGGPA